MSYKTIVVYLPRPGGVANVTDAALQLAGSFGAHVIGLHVSSGLPIAGTIGAQVPPEIIDQYIEYMREDAKAIEAAFARSVKGADVKTEWRGPEEASAGVDILAAISEQTRCADLVIVGQTDAEQRAGELTTDIILAAGRPVLIVPATGKSGGLPGKAVIGWDGSREAARAAFDALPLLKRATAVSVVTVGKGDDVKEAVRNGGVDLAEALVRHGVKAEVAMIAKGDSTAGQALIECVSSHDADLLVMGCYSHSRLRERLFGGATRHLLENMTVPVLMSH